MRSGSVTTSTSAGPSCANAAASASSSWSRSVTRTSVGAAQLRVRRELGVVQRGLPHVPFRRALFLGDLAELRVVEQHVRDVHLVLHRGGDLGEVLTEAAVAGDGHDRTIGRGRPRTHRGREPEADRAEIARHQDVLAGLAFEVATERVRVVADVDGDDGVLGRVARQRFEERRRRDAAAVVVERAPGLLRVPDRAA